jgi:DNA-directed RNA polymerase sigma subunit (sigma70/sigma32)
VIVEHFCNDRPLADVAMEMGVSRERARQIKVKGVDALRKRLKRGDF